MTIPHSLVLSVGPWSRHRCPVDGALLRQPPADLCTLLLRSTYLCYNVIN